MRDYEKLVKRLRICPDYNDGCKNCPHEHDLGCRSTTMREAADAIEELIMQQRGNEEVVKVMQMEIDRLLASRKPKENIESKWISVEERLPEKYDQVLVYGRNGVQIDYYTGEKSVCGNPLFMVSEAKVTHWLYVPEPPKEEK